MLQALAAGTATAAIGAVRPYEALAAAKSPNEKLNVGIVGVAGKGASNLKAVNTENIVALCDIDSQRLSTAAAEYPKARTYSDYRKLLEQSLDAVVVSTPDHMHALPVLAALALGLDVYCEKPLAHNVREVRLMREAAAKQKAVTQMGTQVHAGDNYRRAVEIVQAGVIGKVNRVHVWQGGPVRAGVRVAEGKPPAHVDYDLWLGPAPYRPFHESHFHFNWRYWWDFGGGQLADFGCHYMDLPFWALKLGAPTSAVAKGEKTYKGDNEVPNNMQVDYQFPAQGDQPAVHLTWYHGDWVPPGAEVYAKKSAVLFEGDRGRLLADYGTSKIFMADGSEGKAPAQSIPASIGHHQEWVQAVKTRGTTTCNFDYSGNLAEAVLLGNVAYRAGKAIEWDAKNLKVTNAPEAAQYVTREYRKGWEVKG